MRTIIFLAIAFLAVSGVTADRELQQVRDLQQARELQQTLTLKQLREAMENVLDVFNGAQARPNLSNPNEVIRATVNLLRVLGVPATDLSNIRNLAGGALTPVLTIIQQSARVIQAAATLAQGPSAAATNTIVNAVDAVADRVANQALDALTEGLPVGIQSLLPQNIDIPTGQLLKQLGNLIPRASPRPGASPRPQVRLPPVLEKILRPSPRPSPSAAATPTPSPAVGAVGPSFNPTLLKAARTLLNRVYGPVKTQLEGQGIAMPSQAFVSQILTSLIPDNSSQIVVKPEQLVAAAVSESIRATIAANTSNNSLLGNVFNLIG